MELNEEFERTNIKEILPERPNVKGVDIDSIYEVILCEAAKLKVDCNSEKMKDRDWLWSRKKQER